MPLCWGCSGYVGATRVVGVILGLPGLYEGYSRASRLYSGYRLFEIYSGCSCYSRAVVGLLGS